MESVKRLYWLQFNFHISYLIRSFDLIPRLRRASPAAPRSPPRSCSLATSKRAPPARSSGNSSQSTARSWRLTSSGTMGEFNLALAILHFNRGQHHPKYFGTICSCEILDCDSKYCSSRLCGISITTQAN